MAKLTDLHFWLSRWLQEDTVHSLKLLAITGSEYPELDELWAALDRVELLVGVHIARLEGAEVIDMGGEYLVLPLPDL